MRANLKADTAAVEDQVDDDERLKKEKKKYYDSQGLGKLEKFFCTSLTLTTTASPAPK